MKKIVGIDYDGTILPWGPLTDLDQPPFNGVPAAIRKLKEKGYVIVIHTSRLSPYWWEKDYENFGAENAAEFGKAQIQYVKDYLAKYDIPYDILTAEKIPCDVYFDDNAININSNYELVTAISDYYQRSKDA